MNTNGQMQSKWKHRTTPNMFSQNPTFYLQSTVKTIVDASSVVTNWLGDWKVKITTNGMPPFKKKIMTTIIIREAHTQDALRVMCTTWR